MHMPQSSQSTVQYSTGLWKIQLGSSCDRFQMSRSRWDNSLTFMLPQCTPFEPGGVLNSRSVRPFWTKTPMSVGHMTKHVYVIYFAIHVRLHVHANLSRASSEVLKLSFDENCSSFRQPLICEACHTAVLSQGSLHDLDIIWGKETSIQSYSSHHQVATQGPAANTESDTCSKNSNESPWRKRARTGSHRRAHQKEAIHYIHCWISGSDPSVVPSHLSG